MGEKPTYDELEQKVRKLEATVQELKQERQIAPSTKDLVDSVGRFKNLVANIPGVVYRVKATRDQFYSAEFFNDKITEIFGIEQGQSHSFEEFCNHIPDDDKVSFLHSIQEAVGRVEPWNYEGRFIRPDGETMWFSGTSVSRVEGESVIFFGILMDITRRKEIETEREKLFKELQEALENVRTLSGILPICSACKKIRDDKAGWQRLEAYMYEHSEVQFSHGLCPDCMKRYHPDCVDGEDDK